MKCTLPSFCLPLIALLLVACATPGPLAERVAQTPVSLQGRVAGPAAAVLPGVSSDFRLGSDEGLFHYQAGYAMQPGQAFDRASTHASDQVASQSLGHDLGLRLDGLPGAPLRLGMAYRQQADWRVDTGSLADERAVQLGWAPAFAAFQLRWSESSAAPQPLDCALQGEMSMPLAEQALALKLGGRSCRIVSTSPEQQGLDARAWSAALEWGAEPQRSTLRLQAIDPVPAGDGAASDPQAGYELGLARQRLLGPWSAQSRLAWRRVEDARHPELAEGWNSETQLRRDLYGLGLSAGLSRGTNDLWFVPEGGARSDQLKLGVDLSRWAGGWMPGLAPQTGLFYTRARSLGSSGRSEDDALQWKFSLLW